MSNSMDKKVRQSPACPHLICSILVLLLAACSQSTITSPLPDIDDDAILDALINISAFEYPVITDSNMSHPLRIRTNEWVELFANSRYEEYERWVIYLRDEGQESERRLSKDNKKIEMIWESYYPDLERTFQFIACVPPIYVPGDTISYELWNNIDSLSTYPSSEGWIIYVLSAGRVGDHYWMAINGYILQNIMGDMAIAYIDTIDGGGNLRVWDTFGYDYRAGWDLIGHGWFSTPDTSGVW